MTTVPKHIIEEARKNGIVPGAIIRSAKYVRSGATQAVLPYEQWGMFNGEPNNGKGIDGFYLRWEGQWAEVITPAPSSEPEGLKEGDSVECGPAMRAAIIELAKELGLSIIWPENDNAEAILWFADGLHHPSKNNECIQRRLTTAAFITKMIAEAAKPKPIKIGSDKVEFRSGSIKVGCTTVDNATVRAIAEKLID